MKSSILFFLITSCAFYVHAQTARIDGKILNAQSSKPLSGAHIKLLSVADTSAIRRAVAGPDGVFSLSDLPYGSYFFEVTFLGYSPLRRTIKVDRSSVDLGTTYLKTQAIALGEVLVSATPPAIQKGDTTEYVSGAFKMNRDALAEDLVTKLPGVTVENGTVKARGEDIQQILVDGRPFFGTDPMLALRNLPADAIEKIQVFDKLSDQAEFTGFDDGQSLRTMNLITRESRRRSQFGRLYAGYGENSRYTGGGAMNIFNEGMRLSLIGLTNNVNQQNFSMEDILGALGGSGQPRGGMMGAGFGGRGGRGGGGGGGGFGGQGGGNRQRPGGGMDAGSFLIGQQDGVTTAHSVGLNYSDSWPATLSITGSYFFNRTENENGQTLSRRYFLPGDSSSYYDETSATRNTNFNHRANLRLEYNIDSSNSLLFTPRVSFQNSEPWSTVHGVNSLPGGISLSEAANDNSSSTSGYNYSQNLLFRHKFDLPGRTFSLGLGLSRNHKSKGSALTSLITYFPPASVNGSAVDQTGDNSTNSQALSLRLAYTEPLSIHTLVQLSYAPSFSKDLSDTRTSAFDSVMTSYTKIDSALSNSYENRYTTQNAAIEFLYREERRLNMSLGVSYQMSELEGNKSFPTVTASSHAYKTFLPSAMLNYTPSLGHNLRITYRASTQAPSITQVQDVIDNTNPLFLSGGNPALRQSVSHSLMARLSETEASEGTSRIILLGGTYTADYIANASTTFARDTLLSSGVRATRGTQLTSPVNLDGYWNVRSFVNWGFPFALISSNLSLNVGVSYARSPGMVGGLSDVTNNWTLSPGFVVASNVNEDVDFQLSYSGNITAARNSLQNDLNTNYYAHTVRVRSTLTFWEVLVLRNDLAQTVTTGLSEGYDQHTILWTMSLSLRFLSDNRGELRVAVNDILNQNQSITRTITDAYVEDSTSRVLPRYMMLMFTYTLR